MQIPRHFSRHKSVRRTVYVAGFLLWVPATLFHVIVVSCRTIAHQWRKFAAAVRQVEASWK